MSFFDDANEVPLEEDLPEDSVPDDAPAEVAEAEESLEEDNSGDGVVYVRGENGKLIEL